jgi:beta-glucosidase
MQESGVGACLKHLIANESETDRNTVNSVVDEATLRELYLLPVRDRRRGGRRVVDHGGVQRRQRVGRHRAAHVNNEIVKGEWGYDG